MKKYLIWLGVIIVVGGGLWFWINSFIPKGQDYSVEYEILGVEHIPEGSEHPAYNSNPPSSGWHYGEPAEVKFYDIGQSPPDEQLIHNLEHGDIWIAYHPRISEAVKKELKNFVAAKVVVTAREINETDLALVAWGRVDAFNLENGVLDEQRVKDFILRYVNRGPEKILPAR